MRIHRLDAGTRALLGEFIVRDALLGRFDVDAEYPRVVTTEDQCFVLLRNLRYSPALHGRFLKLELFYLLQNGLGVKHHVPVRKYHLAGACPVHELTHELLEHTRRLGGEGRSDLEVTVDIRITGHCHACLLRERIAGVNDFKGEIRKLVGRDVDVVHLEGIQRHGTKRSRLVDSHDLDPMLARALEYRERELRIIHAPAANRVDLRRVKLEAHRLRQLRHLFVELAEADIESGGWIHAYVAYKSLRPTAYRFHHLATRAPSILEVR